jgi:hypothetical protein
MSTYTFERESRTPFSESWSVRVEGDEIGRVDLHFAASGFVQATLCVPREFDDDDIEDLMAEIDERLVLPVDAYREDFIVTVWRGEKAGVFSEELDLDEEQDEDEDEADTNGASPRA